MSDKNAGPGRECVWFKGTHRVCISVSGRRRSVSRPYVKTRWEIQTPTGDIPSLSQVNAFDISFLHGPLIPQGELPFHRREDVFSLRSIMGILLCPGIGGWMFHTSDDDVLRTNN
jgi:hypothetical protein